MKKTILITGSTDGIGKLAATKLAEEGHTLLLHGRNPAKLQQVVAELQAQTGSSIKGFVADFSDLASVKSMAVQVKKQVTAIDVLINNAGVFKSSTPLTKDGYDIRFAVNYFAPYLLTELLLPILQKGTAPRIINLSSAAQASVSLEALKGQQHLSTQAAYAQSKLALTMWSFDLAKKREAISVIPVNPGSLLNTNMVREAYGRYWSSADKGATILYDLAVSAAYEGVTGKYFDNDAGDFGQAHSDAYSDEKIERLINTTKELLSDYL